MQFCNASRPSKSVESKRDRPTQKIGVVHQKIRRVICRDGCFHVLRPPENPKPQKILLEKVYWEARNAEWRLVTDKMLPDNKIHNLEF